MFDYIVVGAGLFGAVFARELTEAGKKCLILERRNHIGGNCYTENVNGINVHKYGAHIFRTNDSYIWEYIRRFAEFNNFVNSPIAQCSDGVYNLPFNMNTFSKMWGIRTPSEAQEIILKQSKEIRDPKNLEEKAISLVGRDIYEKFIKGYTEKQWGRKCVDLPSSILRRIPVRFIYDNNYFNDRYQGIPIGGYTKLFSNLLENIPVELECDFLKNREFFEKKGKKVIFTGAIDEFFNFSLGELQYRSLAFEEKEFDIPNFQGVAVCNYPELNAPYTRSIEHKHFEFGTQPTTIVSYEYSVEWNKHMEPYYPINDQINEERYQEYKNQASKLTNIKFGGRLGEYKYYDMQDTIKSALLLANKELKDE